MPWQSVQNAIKAVSNQPGFNFKGNKPLAQAGHIAQYHIYLGLSGGGRGPQESVEETVNIRMKTLAQLVLDKADIIRDHPKCSEVWSSIANHPGRDSLLNPVEVKTIIESMIQARRAYPGTMEAATDLTTLVDQLVALEGEIGGSFPPADPQAPFPEQRNPRRAHKTRPYKARNARKDFHAAPEDTQGAFPVALTVIRPKPAGSEGPTSATVHDKMAE
ncbi:hypothetical protein GE09DRAFT_1217363 [Coniochaeta sp. 2T2.1]|nr:hypothetical protein GE09DRAFT_1217363 [Coniochaeta sp. 2T2.1]